MTLSSDDGDIGTGLGNVQTWLKDACFLLQEKESQNNWYYF